jgi:hypothetical protein
MLSAAAFAPDNGNESSDQERNSSSDEHEHSHSNKKGGAKPKRRRKREIGLQGEGRQAQKKIEHRQSDSGMLVLTCSIHRTCFLDAIAEARTT